MKKKLKRRDFIYSTIAAAIGSMALGSCGIKEKDKSNRGYETARSKSK